MDRMHGRGRVVHQKDRVGIGAFGRGNPCRDENEPRWVQVGKGSQGKGNKINHTMLDIT